MLELLIYCLLIKGFVAKPTLRKCVYVYDPPLAELLPDDAFPNLVHKLNTSEYKSFSHTPTDPVLNSTARFTSYRDPGYGTSFFYWLNFNGFHMSRYEPYEHACIFWLPIQMAVAAEWIQHTDIPKISQSQKNAIMRARRNVGLDAIESSWYDDSTSRCSEYVWIQSQAKDILWKWLTLQKPWQELALRRRHVFYSMRIATELLVCQSDLYNELMNANMIAISHEDKGYYAKNDSVRSLIVPYFINMDDWTPVALTPDLSDVSKNTSLTADEYFSEKQTTFDIFLESKSMNITAAMGHREGCHMGSHLCKLGLYNMTRHDFKILSHSFKLKDESFRLLPHVVRGKAFGLFKSVGASRGYHLIDTDEVLKVKEGMVKVRESYAVSKFCLVPMGNTFARKALYSIILSICVPIIVSDALPLPFDKIIKWNKFIVWIRVVDFLQNGINLLNTAMQQILTEPGRLLEMQNHMRKIRPFILLTDYYGTLPNRNMSTVPSTIEYNYMMNIISRCVELDNITDNSLFSNASQYTDTSTRVSDVVKPVMLV